MLRRLLVGTLTLLCAVALARAEEPAEFVISAIPVKLGGWELQAGGLVVREGQPAVSFATLQKPKGKRELAFAVVFKHRYGQTSKSNTSEDTNEDDRGILGCKQSITLDDAKLKLSYSVRFNRGTGAILSESASVDGKAVDLKKGRVVLLDLTTKPPRWVQKNLKSTVMIGDAAEEAQARDLGQKLIADLTRGDEARKILGLKK